MIQSESKKIILSVISIAILIIVFVGISYAALTMDFIDSKANGLSTGTISLVLENGNDSISMTNVMPISDIEGKNLAGQGNVYDFTVKTNLSPNTTINYEISAEKNLTNQVMLDNDSVRIYLQKFGKSGYEDTPITKDPQPFTPLESTSFLGSKKGSMILYSGSFSNSSNQSQEFTESFRLRFWVYENTIIDSVSRQFQIYLNVTAKVI